MAKSDPDNKPQPAPGQSLDAPPINALKPGEKLDRRLGPIRWVKETKAALAQDPEGSTRAILIHSVAVNVALQRLIFDHAMANPGGLIVEGQLHPLLAQDLAKLQGSTRAALAELNRTGKGKSSSQKTKGAGPQVADLVLLAGEDEK